jgi:reverse gyrase
MSQESCLSCGNKSSWAKIHKCKDRDHIFCDKCKNGDCCPKCGSRNVWWNYDNVSPK